MFNFKCPYCGTSLEANDNYTGKSINCPACAEVLIVPDQFMQAGTEFAGYTIQDVICANMLWTTYRAIGVSKSFGKTVMLRVPTTFIRNQGDGVYKKFSAVVRSMGAVGIDEFPELIESSVEGNIPYFVFDSYPDSKIVRHLNVSATFKSSYDSLRIIRKLIAALKRLWEEQNIVVQSIRPENICYYGNNKLHIMDLGISQFALDNPDLLNCGLDIWDEAYTAPELIETGSADKPESDIYSLGSLLFFLLTGRDPVNADEGGISIAGGVSIKVYNSDVPDSIDNLYKRMIEKSSLARYTDYKELLREIDTVLQEQTGDRTVADLLGGGDSYHETSTMAFDMSGIKEEMAQGGGPAFDFGEDDKEVAEEVTEKKKSMLPVIVLILLAVGGAAAYFAFFK